jgi:hypothetical protein
MQHISQGAHEVLLRLCIVLQQDAIVREDTLVQSHHFCLAVSLRTYSLLLTSQFYTLLNSIKSYFLVFWRCAVSCTKMKISAQVRECLRSYSSLTSVLEGNNEHVAFKDQLKDAISRFKIWSSTIGAHRTGRSGLDFRLREASHLQEHVNRLLSSMKESLDDG